MWKTASFFLFFYRKVEKLEAEAKDMSGKERKTCGKSTGSTCARRFELPTFWSVARRSIQLSYAHMFQALAQSKY